MRWERREQATCETGSTRESLHFLAGNEVWRSDCNHGVIVIFVGEFCATLPRKSEFTSTGRFPPTVVW